MENRKKYERPEKEAVYQRVRKFVDSHKDVPYEEVARRLGLNLTRQRISQIVKGGKDGQKHTVL